MSNCLLWATPNTVWRTNCCCCSRQRQGVLKDASAIKNNCHSEVSRSWVLRYGEDVQPRDRGNLPIPKNLSSSPKSIRYLHLAQGLWEEEDGHGFAVEEAMLSEGLLPANPRHDGGWNSVSAELLRADGGVKSSTNAVPPATQSSEMPELELMA